MLCLVFLQSESAREEGQLMGVKGQTRMQLWEPGFYRKALPKFDISPINRLITKV